MDFKRQTLAAQPYLYVDRDCPYEGPRIAEAMGSAFAEVAGFVAAKGIVPAGPAMAVYVSMDPERLRFRGAVPVSEADTAKAGGGVRADTLPAGEAMTTTHVGSYASLNLTHRALWDHMESEGIAAAWPIWEVYVDDPSEVAEDRLRTEVFRAIG